VVPNWYRGPKGNTNRVYPGDCAGDMAKLTGKTDFSTVSSNLNRRQLYLNAEWLP